jgi:Short C-terminal domain
VNRSLIFLVLSIVGCAANPGVVQTAPGVYFISREDKAGVFGNPSAMKADVIREANDFAAKQGKVAIAVSTNGTSLYPGHFATFDYQFKLVDPDSPEAKATNVLVPTPNVRTQVDVRSHDAPTPTVKPDVYAELVKLDDLHKKGILTDAEFEAQKKKLLDQN